VQTLDQSRIEAFAGLIAVEAGAAVNAALVNIGDRLGLYRAMADSQPVTAAELAARTSTHERYVREWLNAQAAGSFVTYDAAADTYVLPAEHAFVLADETSPVAMAGIYSALTAAIESREHVAERFLSGDGLGWHEHHHDLFHGTERAFGALYRMHLLDDWLPAVDGLVERLDRGATVADVGCGHGASAIMMAQAFPNSTFTGIDVHAESIETARRRAAEAGVEDRVTFEVADAVAYAGTYDVVAFFDALHDLGDPVGAARRARAALAPDGVCLVVEPFAGDTVEENLTPIGRYFYGISTLVCTPGSLSQPGRAGLGTQAGEARLRDVLVEGGFGSVRRVAETPFNLVLEARGQSIVS
jgi:2-polyprenyl-3-methyl-5-hydroxy-6-metoxy-1,4-benzoquinol methylase